MPIHSMTGFASQQTHLSNTVEGTEPAWRLGLDIRSVNSRFLDLSFKMPDELRAHEAMLRETLTQALRRGKVEVRIQFEGQSTAPMSAPEPAWLEQLQTLQQQVQAALPLARPLSVADVLRLSPTNAPPPIDLGPSLQSLCAQVLRQLQQAREREGARLAQLLQDRVTLLRGLAQRAAPLVPQLVEQQRLRFLDRWREALALSDGGVLPETAQERALTEATAFAIRIDVAEELSRLLVHLDEMARLLAKPPAEGVGKRLEFLIQELHREANTLGAKSATMELTQISVDMKVLIEQLREQVQNIE